VIVRFVDSDRIVDNRCFKTFL